MAHLVLACCVCAEVRDQYNTKRHYFILLYLIYGEYNEMRLAGNVKYMGKTRPHNILIGTPYRKRLT
jgi:hypothetical protein